jgi:hypothetical protein
MTRLAFKFAAVALLLFTSIITLGQDTAKAKTCPPPKPLRPYKQWNFIPLDYTKVKDLRGWKPISLNLLSGQSGDTPFRCDSGWAVIDVPGDLTKDSITGKWKSQPGAKVRYYYNGCITGDTLRLYIPTDTAKIAVMYFLREKPKTKRSSPVAKK